MWPSSSPRPRRAGESAVAVARRQWPERGGGENVALDWTGNGERGTGSGYGLVMITCMPPPPATAPAPPIIGPAIPGIIGVPVKVAVPDRIDARYRGSR